MGTMTRAGGQTHFNKTKHGMNKMREEQTRLLQRLSLQAESCRSQLDDKLSIAENIISVAEQNRKMETEREKVVHFYPTLLMTDEGVETLTSQMAEQVGQRTPRGTRHGTGSRCAHG